MRKQCEDLSTRTGRSLTTKTPQERSRTVLPRLTGQFCTYRITEPVSSYICTINNNGKCLLRSGRFSVHPSRRTQTKYALPTSRLPPSYEVSTRHCGQVVWRRELSRSALAGRHSRPDRREGCQAPCPPILRHHIPLPDREATAPQGRKTGERG